jgi:N-methylhydantoinase B
MTHNPVKIEIYKHLFAAVAEEMGVVLRKSSYSPNIKERRDFSCALFDAQGRMTAQAAHIPVHLGAMPLSVQAAVKHFTNNLYPGDLIILNDPFHGGTHLPDITMGSPVFLQSSLENRATCKLIGFVASRAHHADVGGMTPGSMPLASEIFQEGIIIPPIKLLVSGKTAQDILDLILANVRTPEERHGDLLAQMAANQRGVDRLVDLVARYGLAEINEATAELLSYTERMTRRLLETIPDGDYRFRDQLDDDGINPEPVPILVKISIRGDQATVDFTGSAPQQVGSVNAVEAITYSAVYYVFRCLLGMDVPNNAGCLAPIKVILPPGSIVNAMPPASVAGGNVETSQRIVDVLLGALAQACPGKIPAASQGTMNNITIGGTMPSTRASNKKPPNEQFTYYETIGGGTGARPDLAGISAIHSHMTNTLNTPIEALEFSYPLRVCRYEIRAGSGGEGKFNGGDGIIREIEVLTDCQVTLLTERRKIAPYGMAGGKPGAVGENIIIRDGKHRSLPSKGKFDLKAGDVLSIRTPGGGGYGMSNPKNK